MRIDGNGNVGIGLTQPDYKLSVGSGSILLLNGQGNFSGTGRIAISNTLVENEIHGNGANGKQYDVGFLRLSAGGGTNTTTKSYIDLYGYAAHCIAMGTCGVERMTINNVGNVGIGTTNPRAKLEVSGSLDQTTQLWESSQIILSRVDSGYSAIMGEIGSYHKAGVNGATADWQPVYILKHHPARWFRTNRKVSLSNKNGNKCCRQCRYWNNRSNCKELEVSKWTLVTELHRDDPMNNPWNGTKESGAPDVLVPLNTLSSSNGTDLEIKIEWDNDDGSTSKRFYKGWRLDVAFHYTHNTNEGPYNVYTKWNEDDAWYNSTAQYINWGNDNWNWKFCKINWYRFKLQ